MYYRDALKELQRQGYQVVEIAGWKANLADYVESLGADGPPCAILLGCDGEAAARIVDMGSTGWLDLNTEPMAIARR